MDISKCSRMLKWHYADSKHVGLQDFIEYLDCTFGSCENQCVGTRLQVVELLLHVFATKSKMEN